MSKKGRKSKRAKAQKKQQVRVLRATGGHHAYLNALGIESTDSCVFNSADDTDERQEEFLEERATHSFDLRETWSLEYTLATWLYEHLMAYREYASGTRNRTFVVEEVHVTKKGKVKAKRVTVTQKKGLSLACKYLRRSLTSDWLDARRVPYAQAAVRIVAELLPSLWW